MIKLLPNFWTGNAPYCFKENCHFHKLITSLICTFRSSWLSAIFVWGKFSKHLNTRGKQNSATGFNVGVIALPNNLSFSGFSSLSIGCLHEVLISVLGGLNTCKAYIYWWDWSCTFLVRIFNLLNKEHLFILDVASISYCLFYTDFNVVSLSIFMGEFI